MIDKIAYELVKSISVNVGFFDKWAGLVKPMRKMVQKSEKVFPVAINTPSNCDQSDYTALVPDDSKRSVAYIEMVQSPTVDVIRHGSRQLSAQLRLVVWYNLDRITEGKYVSEDMLVDQVFRSLPRRLHNSLFNGASQVHIMSTGVTYGAEVVSQYTYNEAKSQFVTHPYGVFAIDLDVWYITTYCQNPFDNAVGCVTGKGNHENYVTLPSLSELAAIIEGDNLVFSGVVDTGNSDTTLTLFWGETGLTMTNEVDIGVFTEYGSFSFELPTISFGVDDIFWFIMATNNVGSINSDTQGSNVNPSTWDMLAPSALVLTVLSASSIRLNWTVNSVDRDGHKIERSTDGVSFTEVGSVLGATATFTDTGLTDWTTYYYRVRAFRGATYSPYCSIQNAKTWGLDFIITIDTTKAGSASNVFVFPLTAKTASNVTINWGDGNTDTYTTIGDKSHTYATSGVYQVKIGGGMTAFAFNNAGDKLKLMFIDNWGSAVWSSWSLMFYGCSNMQGRYEDSPNTASVPDMYAMFSGCSAFNQSVSNFNTVNVTNMDAMFYGCTLFNQSVSNFNTASVTDMGYMFNGCSAFNQSVSNFDVSNVTNMEYMFSGCNINTTGTTNNYDETLIAWANNRTTPNNLAFHGGTSKYGAGEGAAARATLISKGWTITDGGLA